MVLVMSSHPTEGPCGNSDSNCMSSSCTTSSNPDDPQHRIPARAIFQLSPENCTEDDPENDIQKRFESNNENWTNQNTRGRSDSWTQKHGSAARIAAKLANFKKSATQTNLHGGEESSHHQPHPNRRLFNLSNGSSLNSSFELLEQHPTALENVSAVSLAKHVHTEQILAKHSLKTHSTKCQRLLDAYFGVLAAPANGANIDEQTLLEGLTSIGTLMANAWLTPQIGMDLAYGLCDYIRENGYLTLLTDDYFLNPSNSLSIITSTARTLVPILDSSNRTSIIPLFTRIVEIVKTRLVDSDCVDQTGDGISAGIALLEQLFKCDPMVVLNLLNLGALDYCLTACKTCRNPDVHRHVAVALANLCISSDEKEIQQGIMARNVPDWLYFLASSRDDPTRYYACLAVCLLVNNKEIESNVVKSGALTLVQPFLRGRNPIEFAFAADYRHQGRPKQWLIRLVSLLYSKRGEPRMMAAFHLALDASIKKTQEREEELKDTGAVEALRQAAGMPDQAASEFARRALEIIGEKAPYKLKSQVPLWTVDDVQYWVVQIGFSKYADAFGENKVDGDLLLLLSNEELQNDIGMKSGLFRKRFMRELDSLKMAADYSCVDGTKLDRFLTWVNPRFSIYTYPLLELGVIDCHEILSLNDDILKRDCRISNPVHRTKLLRAIEDSRHIEDMEVAVLKKHMDIFISYRRSTGSQLASLLKVLLQLRGYKVFLDVDRLYAGQFDYSLFKNIQAADHFLLVLSPQSLDRCLDDHHCNDWVHKEVACAFRFNKNIIPILDPQFEWPDECRLPSNVGLIKQFNHVNWIHEYQDACVSKILTFVQDYANANSTERFSLAQCDPDSTDFVEHVS